MVYRSLHTWISDDEVLPKQISRCSRKQDYPIRISDDDVLFDNIARNRRPAGRTNAVVIAWSREPVSTDPVRTEPVATGASGESYTAARCGDVSVSYGDVVLQQVVRSVVYLKARETVGGTRHVPDCRAATVNQMDA